MPSRLRIADNFSVPAEAVTQTFAIVAKRGAGKTYTAAVLTEELLKASFQVCVADPVGVWWGLRASADGRSEGLRIIVLGGEHGDLPLEVTAGEAIADLVAGDGLSAVLDLSALRKGEQARFMTDFAERLYHRNRLPLHLVFDEADAFAPQRPMRGQERLLGAIEDLVRRGRAKGIGVTLVTQRAAVLNKDVLTQVEVLVALRTIAPQDRDAVDAWVRVHGTPEQRDELMRSLPSLPVGTAWFWSPGWLNVFQKVNVRRRETFDSSSTPKVGAKIQELRKLAEIDLDRVRGRLAAMVERAREDDPRELRRRIAGLERQLRARPAEAMVQWVEVPVLEPAQVTRLEALLRSLTAGTSELAAVARQLGIALLRGAPDQTNPPATPALPSGGRRAELTPPPGAVPRNRAEPEGSSALAAPQRRLLEALAQFEALGVTDVPLKHAAALSGASPKSSAFDANRARLRAAGLIEYGNGTLRLTAASRECVSARPLPPASTAELIDRYKQVVLSDYQSRLLDELIAAHPNDLGREDLASRAGVSPRSSAFDAALADLRSLGLIDYLPDRRVRAADGLFVEQTVQGTARP